jgi:hypothetical protein
VWASTIPAVLMTLSIIFITHTNCRVSNHV